MKYRCFCIRPRLQLETETVLVWFDDEVLFCCFVCWAISPCCSLLHSQCMQTFHINWRLTQQFLNLGYSSQMALIYHSLNLHFKMWFYRGVTWYIFLEANYMILLCNTKLLAYRLLSPHTRLRDRLFGAQTEQNDATRSNKSFWQQFYLLAPCFELQGSTKTKFFVILRFAFLYFLPVFFSLVCHRH